MFLLLLKKPAQGRCRGAENGCCGVQEGDKLLWVGQCQEDSSVLMASSAGKALHLPTTDSELRPQGRPAMGLRVIPPVLHPPTLSSLPPPCAPPPAHSRPPWAPSSFTAGDSCFASACFAAGYHVCLFSVFSMRADMPTRKLQLSCMQPCSRTLDRFCMWAVVSWRCHAASHQYLSPAAPTL